MPKLSHTRHAPNSTPRYAAVCSHPLSFPCPRVPISASCFCAHLCHCCAAAARDPGVDPTLALPLALVLTLVLILPLALPLALPLNLALALPLTLVLTLPLTLALALPLTLALTLPLTLVLTLVPALPLALELTLVLTLVPTILQTPPLTLPLTLALTLPLAADPTSASATVAATAAADAVCLLRPLPLYVGRVSFAPVATVCRQAQVAVDPPSQEMFRDVMVLCTPPSEAHNTPRPDYTHTQHAILFCSPLVTMPLVTLRGAQHAAEHRTTRHAPITRHLILLALSDHEVALVLRWVSYDALTRNLNTVWYIDNMLFCYYYY